MKKQTLNTLHHCVYDLKYHLDLVTKFVENVSTRRYSRSLNSTLRDFFKHGIVSYSNLMARLITSTF